MQDTYYIKAIILKRTSFREYDSKVTVYSLEKGKIDLVARGTKKILSKLAGHLEPLTLTDIMVVRGKQFDYIGSAVSENVFKELKHNYEKLNLAGEAINIFNKLVKEEEPDRKLFSLLGNFFIYLNNLSDNFNQPLSIAFKIKLINHLGYRPNFKKEDKLSKNIADYFRIILDSSNYNEILSVSLLEDEKKIAKESLDFYILNLFNS